MFLLQEKSLADCRITPQDRVLIGLSGGADSVALLLEFVRLFRENRVASVGAAHLNHSIRGVEAERDAAFCKELCGSLSVAFYEQTIDVPAIAKQRGLSLETAAREERYRFLEQTRNENGFDCIAVAHHKDDQAETLLLHLMRGSGTDGLCGMRFRNGSLVRPFLNVSKSDIMVYLAEQQQPFCTDATNSETDAERNRIRHVILPEWKRIRPGITNALNRTACYVQEDSDYLNAEADRVYHAIKNRFSLSAYAPAVRMRVLRRYLPYDDFDRRDLETLDSLLQAETGTVRNLKLGYSAWTDSERLYVESLTDASFCMPFAIGQTVQIPCGTIFAEPCDQVVFPCEGSQAYLDADALGQTLLIRTPRKGDRFRPFGMNGSKLLSDYLTDRKVGRFHRQIPLLCDESGIVYVAGFTVDDRVKVTQETKRMVHIIYEQKT